MIEHARQSGWTAAVGAGIVNWVSHYGTADIARTKEMEFFDANRVKAATRFIHGEVDQRVPYSEAEQMFVALKRNGVPAKVIQYAGQPHGSAGPRTVVHCMLNDLRWLDIWLKPAGRRQVTTEPR